MSTKENATLRNQMPSCPAPGLGVNRWLIIAANQLKRQGASLSDAEKIILEQMTRPPKGSELRTTLRKVYQQSPAQWHSAQTHRKPNKRHELNPYNQTSDPDLIKRVVETGFRQEDLKALSPAIPFPLLSRKSVVRSLFPPGCLICCAKGREYGYETGPVESFDSFDGFNFIVPQPMTALKGWTQDGKLSPKSKDNTGSWRYFVYESDGLSLDEQAAVLFELAHYLPLALVVFSGNQSLHGWFFVQSLDDVALRRFQCLAVRLGACTGPLNRSQLVRMPGGWNKDVRAKQEVVFFNPGAIRL